jgi:pimeloyl-ACP methyl ester carboxylesterase
VPSRTGPGLGVELAYDEHGSGPPVLLIHGTALTRLTWRETVDALGDGVRTIAYDRRGYGDSGAPENYSGTTIEEQAEDAARLLEALEAAPAVACGHSAGAIVALDLMLRHPALVRAAVLVEPPLLSLAPAGSETLGEIRERVEAAAREGGPDAAVDAFLEAEDGSDALDAAGPERARAIRASARAAVADFGAVTNWELSRRRLRAIEAPTVVVRGTRSAPVYREVAAALAGMLPAAELREVEAGHVAPLDAPAELASIVRSLL